MGTPLYMAPELVEGASAAGPSTDMFSFGVLAYELLAKELPFAVPPVLERLSGRAIAARRSLMDARPDLTPGLCALIDRCLAAAPDERPAANVVADTLQQISP
jgi:serine/threonine-protein kinase